MAHYLTPNGPVTFTPYDEIEADLADATEQRRSLVLCMSSDLRQVLQQFRDMVDFIRRDASNNAEAHELLKKVSPRDA